MIVHCSPPYESPDVRAITGQTIRPGGLELTERAARFCGLGVGERVLDVGCGAGATAAFLQERFQTAAVGIDPSALLLMDARKDHAALPLVRGDGTSLPLAGECFGAVFCECVLSLVADRRKALAECHRVLRPGGHLVIADLYWRSEGLSDMAASPESSGCLAGALPRRRLETLVAAAGFDLCLWENHSPHLKILAAKLVWDGLRLPDFWGAAGRPGCGGRGRPGYGLLVARKRSTING